METKLRYSIDELANFLASANLAKLERETEVSRHNLLRVKRLDRTIPLKVIEDLNKYYGA